MIINKLIGKNWYIQENDEVKIFFKGFFFLDKTIYKSQNAINEFVKVDFSNDKDLGIFLNSVNGFYSAIIEQKKSNQSLLIVDKVSSMPLFYRTQNDSIEIYDNVSPDTIENYRIIENAVLEFQVTMYCLNNKTILSDVHRLIAGSFFRFSKDGQQTVHYYEYLPDTIDHSSNANLIESFNHIMHNAIDRCIIYLNGRKAIVPLSGGLDSRLIASMMKKKGYENVLCYFYGRKGSKDMQKSKEIASVLGYRWFQVEYNKKNLRKIYKSDKMMAYWKYAGNASSIPHPDEFLALSTIHANKLIEEDAVFLPGHTGDFISGGHLIYVYDENLKPTDNLIGSIINKHCSANKALHTKTLIEYLRDEITNGLSIIDFDSKTISEAYEFWEWKERQSKYIINTVRSYEVCNYDWHMPLWDSEIMDFWKKMELKKKINKNLYRLYLAETDSLGVFKDIIREKNKNMIWKVSKRERVFNLINASKVPKSFIFYIRNVDRLNIEYKSHVIGLARTFPYWTYILTNVKKRNAQSIFAKEYLKKIWFLYKFI